MWVWIPAWSVAALVSLSKILNHNCFVLWMGRKAVGPVCSVMHLKEPRTLIVKEKGLAPVFLDLRLEHPAGWICARYLLYCMVIHFHIKMETTFNICYILSMVRDLNVYLDSILQTLPMLYLPLNQMFLFFYFIGCTAQLQWCNGRWPQQVPWSVSSVTTTTVQQPRDRR